MNKKYRSTEDLPLLMKVEDLMPVLGIGRNTAYNLVRANKIKTIRIGRLLRVPKQSVEDYLNNIED